MRKLAIQAVRKIDRFGYRMRFNQSELERLKANPHPLAQAMARSFIETFHWRVSSEEQTWIEKIEAMRAAVNASTEFLETVNRRGVPEDVTVGAVAKQASIRKQWGLLMFRLIRETQPENCLELGTCLGVSGSYQAAALQLNGHGRLITMERSQARVNRATQNFKLLGFTNVEAAPGSFADTLPGVLEIHSPVDFAFIDGHHDEHATVQYFRQIAPYTVSGRSIIVFDDIAWSSGMKRAWETLKTDKHISLAVDLFKIGICVTGEGAALKQTYKLALD